MTCFESVCQNCNDLIHHDEPKTFQEPSTSNLILEEMQSVSCCHSNTQSKWQGTEQLDKVFLVFEHFQHLFFSKDVLVQSQKSFDSLDFAFLISSANEGIILTVFSLP